jgi:hypothetical protein
MIEQIWPRIVPLEGSTFRQLRGQRCLMQGIFHCVGVKPSRLFIETAGNYRSDRGAVRFWGRNAQVSQLRGNGAHFLIGQVPIR